MRPSRRIRFQSLRRLCCVAVSVSAIGGCDRNLVELYQPPIAHLSTLTVERTTAESLVLRVTVSEEAGAIRRQVSLTNQALRSHRVDWLPRCGDLIWLLWKPGDTLSRPVFNASYGSGCSLEPKGYTLAAGETYAAAEWQTTTQASKFIGDSLAPGTYNLGVGMGISDMPSVVFLGRVEFIRPK